METYRTSNLNEIAILLAVGKKFLNVEREQATNRATFIFQSDGCETAIKSFYNNEKIASPLDFSQSLQKAKDIIFNQERR